ncbi:hypothetical protein TNCV_972271 [Trichonephila clavipes]|nr:hypothetical protein TNCV_972271 [Trichonephila clavipes]
MVVEDTVPKQTSEQWGDLTQLIDKFQTIFSQNNNKRTTGGRLSNSEPQSSDEEDTKVGTPSPRFHIAATGGLLVSTDLTCVDPSILGMANQWHACH